MITGQGLLGKLVLFATEKLISHKLTVSLDEKKRTCRAFVELYHCLDRIEELNSKLVSLLEIGSAQGGILSGDLEILMPSINAVSQRLLDIRHELHFALNIIDPSLCKAVNQIYSAKGSFLLMLSHGVSTEGENDRASSLAYYAPDQRIISIDMAAYDQWVTNFSASAEYGRDSLEWPQSLLWFGEFEEGFHKASLNFSDRASLQKLRDILVQHGAVLTDARSQLRILIASKFSTEDILYVSKGMPRDAF